MDAIAPAAKIQGRGAQPWYLQLWLQVLVAMAIGIALGHFYPTLGAQMQPLGDGFIKAIRAMIAPIIFCTVVHGIAGTADMARVGRVALKALIYFEVLTTIALIVGLVAVNIFQPGVGLNVDLTRLDASNVASFLAQTHKQTIEQFLLGIIPNSFVGAFTEGNVLQVLYVAIFCGFALSWLGERGRPLIQVIDAASQMLFRIVAIVMWAAPIGAFGAIAFTVGKFGTGSLLSLTELLVSFYVTCLIFVFGVLGPIARWCGFSLLGLIRYIWEELLIVFATSTETVLPRMIAKLEAAGCEARVVGLVIPTGYSFDLVGTCLYLATTAVFLAQATNTPLTIEHQIGLMAVLLLASKGAAGVPGAAFAVLTATLASDGTIPVESVALVLGVHRLLAGGLAPTNLVGHAVATIVVAKWEGALDRQRLHQVLDRNAPVRIQAPPPAFDRSFRRLS